MFQKISIITPSLNSGRYIEEAIQSVLKQNYQNFEHIVIDGGSTDDTIEILKKYPHLKWISESDRGQSHAMNKGFEMSTGEIIVYLNADDYFESGAFHTALEHLDRNDGIFCIAGEINIIDELGNKKKTMDTKVTLFEMLQWWKYVAPLNPSSYFYYREVQEEVEGFDKNNHLTMDYDFLLKVVCMYKIKKIENVLGNYRFIKNTKTFETSSSEYYPVKYSFSRKYWNHLSIFEKILVFLDFHFTFNSKYEKRLIFKIVRLVMVYFKTNSFRHGGFN